MPREINKMEQLNERLRTVVEKFNDLKKCGMDEEILIAYIHDRTKLSKGSIKMFLNSMDEFYDKLTANVFLEALGDNE